MTTTPTDALVAGTEQYLSELSDTEFTALVGRVRAPGDAESDAKPTDYPKNWKS